MVQILDICHKFSDLDREWLPGDKYDVTQTILKQEERRQVERSARKTKS